MRLNRGSIVLVVASLIVFGCATGPEESHTTGPASTGSKSTDSAPSPASSGAPAAPQGPSAGLARSAAPFKLSLDRIGEIQSPTSKQPVVLKVDQTLDLNGWTIDEATKSLAGGVDVAIDGRPFPAKYGLDRPDIAKAYKNAELGKSGYSFSMAAREIGVGKHTLTVRPISPDKTKYFEGAPITIEIQ